MIRNEKKVHDFKCPWPNAKCSNFFHIIFIVRQIKGLVFHGIDLGKNYSMDYIESGLGKPESRSCYINTPNHFKNSLNSPEYMLIASGEMNFHISFWRFVLWWSIHPHSVVHVVFSYITVLCIKLWLSIKKWNWKLRNWFER